MLATKLIDPDAAVPKSLVAKVIVASADCVVTASDAKVG